MMAIKKEKQLFFEAMSRLASGVSIVTTNENNRPWGLTISSFTSISASPKLIMISLARNTVSEIAIKESNKFGVSILGESQKNIAQLGSRPGKPKYLDDYIDNNTSSNTFVVKNSLAHLDCTVYKVVEAGDHTIFLGLVEDVVVGEEGNPLLYFSREFGSFINNNK